MTQSMTDSNLNTQFPERTPHCSHRTKQNRHCRLPVLDSNSGLCFRHASLHNQEVDAGNLSAELLGDVTEFNNATEIKTFLAKLLVQIVRNRIAAKRAAVLTYICAQILRSFREMDYEDKLSLANEEPPKIIWDLPRPVRNVPPPAPDSVPDGLSNYA